MAQGDPNNFLDLVIGTTLDATLADCYPNGDWFRVQLVANRTYTFLGTPDTGNLDLYLKYNSGVNVPSTIIDSQEGLFYDEDNFIQFTPRQSGFYFIYAVDTPNVYREPSRSDYVISANVINDFSADADTVGVLFRNYFVSSEIQSGTDRDWFRINIFENQQQWFELGGVDSGGGTLENPYLKVFDVDGNLVAENDSYTSGSRDARLTFQPAEGGIFYVEAGSANGGSGSYKLRTTFLDDFATGRNTRGEIRLNGNNRVVKQGDLEREGDIDWLKVNLTEGEWYKFSLASRSPFNHKHSLFLRSPNNEVVDGSFAQTSPEFRFRATTSGVHHLVARGTVTGIYFVNVTPDAPPTVRSQEPSYFLLGEQQLRLSEIIADTEFSADSYQVFSTVDINQGTTIFPARTLHSFTPAQLPNLTVAANAFGEHTITFRARENNPLTGTDHTGWASAEVVRIRDNRELLASGAQWNNSNTIFDDQITIRFPFLEPSYYQAGQIQEFTPVTGSLKFELEQFIEHVEWIIPNVQFVDSGAADINIFMANLSGTASSAHAPGPTTGGDIILNRGLFQNLGSFNGNDFLRFSLVRSLGKSLGLKAFASSLTMDQSVMGRNNGSTGESFPQTFGFEDVLRLQQMYGETMDTRELGGPRFSSAEDDPRFSTHFYSGDFTAVANYPGSTRDALVDIRPGHFTYLNDNLSPTKTIRLGYETSVEFAVGGKGKDTLIGNAGDNRLQGLQHRDFLSGGLGNDILEGGFGNDIYEFKTTWGNDRIIDLRPFQDSRDGGLDTLRLYANFSPGRIDQDVTFRRLGNDLLIDLDLYGQLNREHGSIMIENMAEPNARVERLELYVGQTLKGTFSLVSAWENSTNVKQRFAGTGENDAFGQLLAAV